MKYVNRQQGYNLVEMSIALVVLGLVIGGALIPLQKRFQDEEIKSAREHLQLAKEAVQTYAVSHLTRGSKIEYDDLIVYDLPANRPYLPCPDIDNDGLEDRSALPNTYPVNTTDLATAGVCDEQKGMLPWRTLNLKDVDPWGNRLSYRVDKKFSSQLFGFDETYSADIFNIALPLTLNSGDLYLTPYATRDEAGAVVCSELSSVAVNIGCPDSALSNVEAGVITGNALVLAGGREVPAYANVGGTDLEGIINGPVFIIVSHGKDGHGAINREGRCRPPPLTTTNLGEIANAYYRPNHFFVTVAVDPMTLTENCSSTTSPLLRENLFVNTPISDIRNAAVDAPDDLLIWSGNYELIGFLLRNRVLPLDKLEFLP